MAVSSPGQETGEGGGVRGRVGCVKGRGRGGGGGVCVWRGRGKSDSAT